MLDTLLVILERSSTDLKGLLLDHFLNNLHEFLEVLEDVLQILGRHASEFKFETFEKFD